MTREDAIKYLRINRKAMTAQMKLALETLVPELREDVEHVCGTCTYWQDGALDRGECQRGNPYRTHSADTCENWEAYEE